MSQNDILALKSHFENWKLERATGLHGAKPFEFYCVEQFLKSADLSDEEILSGLTDGPNDGTVDGFYFFVNGQLVTENTLPLRHKGVESAHVVIMQIRDKAAGFSPHVVEQLGAFADDLFDLSRPMSALQEKYKGNAAAKLRSLMQTFKEQYQRIMGALPAIVIDFFYITRGDEQQPNGWAIAERDKLLITVKKHFSAATCGFIFVDAQELLRQIRTRPLDSKSLPWSASPMQTLDGWVGLVALRDFYEFIKEPTGEFANRFFEANVRGFQRNTPVNKQIRDTLARIIHAFHG